MSAHNPQHSLPVRLLPLLVLCCPVLMPACGTRVAKISDAAILSASFEGGTLPPDARLLVKRRANLDADPQLEIAALIASGDTERLAFLTEFSGGIRLARKVDFHLREPGSYSYQQGRGWVRGDSAPGKDGPATARKAVGRIVRRLQVGTIESKTGPASVMIEYLTEPPGRGRVESHLMVFTGFTKSFDSIAALADHPLLKGDPRIQYEFDKDRQLVLFPKDSGYMARLRWNGRELVHWYPGEPLFTYLPLSATETKSGREYVFQIRNDGGPALLSYISLTFPVGSQVTPLGRNPPRLHRAGSSIHARGGARGGARMTAQSPLLEATVRGWRSFHRTTLRFAVKTADPAPVLTARVVTRGSNDSRLSPPERSSVPVATDQQGYPAYAFSLSDLSGGEPALKPTQKGKAQ